MMFSIYLSLFARKKMNQLCLYLRLYKEVFSSVILFYIEFRIFASILICLLNMPHILSAFKRKAFPSGTPLYTLKAASKLLFSWHFTDIHKISRIIQIVYQIII